MSGVTLSNKVPPIKNPSSFPGTFKPRPSTRSFAPEATPLSIYPVMRSKAALLTIGPISASSSIPFFTLSVLVRSISFGMIFSATSPTNTATEIAMQRSPAEPYAAPIKASIALSMSASGMITI